jgi:hypothetical protein
VAKQCDGCFFPCSGDHAEPDPATLNIKDAVRNVTLGKGPLFVAEMNNGSAQAAGGEEGCSIKIALLVKWYVDNR